MSFSLCVLGSGSAGNCTLLRLGGGRTTRLVLIDAGLSLRATSHRLAPLGVAIEDITDILLTHGDTDHFRPVWLKSIERHGITVHAHRRHRRALLRLGLSDARLDSFENGMSLDEDTDVQSMLLPHDELGSVAFIIEHDGHRLGWATDLGRAPATLLERFVELHGLAIESNYDRRMQVASARPAFLKNRIMGGAGHLSNEQSLSATLRIAGQSRLSQIVLLHLSRQCNDPSVVTRLYARHGAHLLDRLTITNQHEPTPELRLTRRRRADPAPAPRAGEQLAMF